ncbi:cyclic 2,3-diphosphoglycerate synthase [Elusimicrobiota bacterium]
MKKTRNILIIGAGGRDFHNFNTYYRDNARFNVIAFTAAQIPNIDDRRYPALLAGKRYPKGIPIFSEKELQPLIKKHDIDEAVFSYSDLSFRDVMLKASKVLSFGADFKLLGPQSTMIESKKPVISVCAVRTGCGKSQTSRKIAGILKELGLNVSIIRHPMPYGDLSKQICQRFKSLNDLVTAKCTIEEREEYEPHIKEGHTVFAGVDYGQILKAAEKEADVILWDGGNNDLPFYKPDLNIVVVDPHRPGHEISYHPGATNLYMADVIVINKVDTAQKSSINIVRENIKKHNPRATIIEADSPLSLMGSTKAISGKNVLVIEDGPTVTHGEMGYGAAFIAAKRFGAKKIIDPRPYTNGSLKKVFEKYTHVQQVLPAMGYGSAQVKELEHTIKSAKCDLVLVGTPIDLRNILRVDKPMLKVSYSFEQKSGIPIKNILKSALKKKLGGKIK